MASLQTYRAILMPTEAYAPMKLGRYIDRGHKKKLFKGESFSTVARTPDDPYFYYVEEGRILIMFETESGESVPVAWRNEGNAFSAEYDGIATIGRYQMRLMAVQNTVLFSFTQRQLFEISREDPDIFYEFIKACHIHFGQMGHRLSGIANQSSSKRVAMWLEKLCAVHPANDDGTYTIPCTMTLQQISDHLMIHITTCTKLFSALEEQGIIHRTRKTIHVADLKRLELIGVDDGGIAY